MLYIFLSVRSAFGIGHYDFYAPLPPLLNYNLPKVFLEGGGGFAFAFAKGVVNYCLLLIKVLFWVY
jgi:hypothetical protein